jgi:hypothetical protein
MTPCALTTSGASTSSGIATGRALGPSMALHVHAHRLRDSSVRRPTADGALSGCDRWSARLAARSGQVEHGRGLLSGGGGSTAR